MVLWGNGIPDGYDADALLPAELQGHVEVLDQALVGPAAAREMLACLSARSQGLLAYAGPVSAPRLPAVQ